MERCLPYVQNDHLTQERSYDSWPDSSSMPVTKNSLGSLYFSQSSHAFNVPTSTPDLPLTHTIWHSAAGGKPLLLLRSQKYPGVSKKLDLDKPRTRPNHAGRNGKLTLLLFLIIIADGVSVRHLSHPSCNTGSGQ